MNKFKDLVEGVYAGDDETRRILFGRYIEDLRDRSPRNKNDVAEAEMEVTKRTFQRILQGNRISEDTQKNLHIVLGLFTANIDDGNPVLDFETWAEKNAHKFINPDNDKSLENDELKLVTIPNRIVILSTALFGIVVAIGITVFFWFGENDQAEPDKNTNVAAKSPIPDTSQITPSNTRPKPDANEIDILRITKSGERRRSKHHPPRALFTVWNGKLFLKNLILPNNRPILKVEYSRFGNTFTPFDPSDDQLDRSLASGGAFLVNVTFQINNNSSLKKYDLTTQKDYYLRTVARGFDRTVTKDNINRHVSCVDEICVIQRSFSNNALCFGPVLRGRLISGFDKFEVSRNICKDDAPLPLCLNEESLGFKLGRNSRVVFEVDLIDGTSRRYDVSPRSEGVLLPNGDFVSLDALGGKLIHKCN